MCAHAFNLLALAYEINWLFALYGICYTPKLI